MAVIENFSIIDMKNSDLWQVLNNLVIEQLLAIKLDESYSLIDLVRLFSLARWRIKQPLFLKHFVLCDIHHRIPAICWGIAYNVTSIIEYLNAVIIDILWCMPHRRRCLSSQDWKLVQVFYQMRAKWTVQAMVI